MLKAFSRAALGVVCALLIVTGLVGCGGPSNDTKCQSQLGVLAHQEFSETTFKDGGGTGQNDPWGNEITWELYKGWSTYKLTVRSNGPDGLPYTYDDMHAYGNYAIPKKSVDPEAETMSERFTRGITRGAIKGIKQGVMGDPKPKDDSKSKDDGKSK